ncbi:hypothetical protein [Frankia gtarii]|uniref:hypothetical protein n=1 Tax=Frankia gtarii TaxID=2950102 RepID=UPI0021BF3567|nr:hypothetical protein [Frankia gtarii]
MVDTGLGRWAKRQLDPRNGYDARGLMALIALPIVIAGALIGLIFGSADAGLAVAGILWAGGMLVWAFVMLGFYFRKLASREGRAELRAERERRRDPSLHWMDR